SVPSGQLVILGLQLSQKTPENILDATFRNVGRVGEIRLHHRDVAFVGLVKGPDAGPLAPAASRARELLIDAGVEMLPTDEARFRAALGAHFAGTSAAEAK